jgi:catechol 2,3-dioxygenase-like lactoylglutathione lyase family enzyme
MNDAPMKPAFDRAEEDLGNIVELGHVNTRVPDQRLATLFYVTGLGLTRDPYLMTGITNMWINVGRSQFHLPTGAPQVVGGYTALVIPDLEALLRRLASVRQHLADTRFAVREAEGYVEATCPWGNRIRCFAPAPRFGAITLGVPYVELAVGPDTADAIRDFYREILGGAAEAEADAEGRYARVAVGPDQHLVFRETDRALPPYDGAHVQITLVDFSGPHKRLQERGLITEESDQHQYRFHDIVNLQNGSTLARFEHEVRSMRHPLFARPLVNRNPAQSNVAYTPGHDAWV